MISTNCELTETKFRNYWQNQRNARMREIWDIYISLNVRYVTYYEAIIIIINILMQVL